MQCFLRVNSLLERKEILTPATTWMDLEDIMAGPQWTSTVWFPLCEVPGGVRPTETEYRRVGAGDRGGDEELVFNGWFHFGEIRHSGDHGGDSCATMSLHLQVDKMVNAM